MAMARSDRYRNADLTLRVAVADAVLVALGKDTGGMDEEEAERISQSFEPDITEASDVLCNIIDHACDEAIGEVIDLIRKAEGIDTVALDAALGIEPDDITDIEDTPGIEIEE
jgi:hypothetical protein